MFKVGDKGKTRGGDDYEVITAHDGDEGAYLWVFVDGMPSTYYSDGRYSRVTGDSRTLLPPKQKIEGFLRIYENGRHQYVSTSSTQTAHDGIVAIVPITIPYTEGEGLD